MPKENRCDRIVNCLDGEDEVGCEILTMNYGKYRESDSSNTFVKSQANEVSSDTTEKNSEAYSFMIVTSRIFNKIIDNDTKFYITEVSTEASAISTSSYFFYQTETQTYNNKNSNTVDIDETTPEITMSSVKLTFTCKK